MQRPNFFIVGAPKCGTTALHEYLRTHENIYMCEPKEPNFFSEDFPSHRYVTNVSDYLRLFEQEDEKVVRFGEASAWYLYSQNALTNIYKFDRSARIIAMVRNPLDLLPSLHGMLVQNFAEDEHDLERAWDLQEVRRSGANSVKNLNKRFDTKTRQYSDVCKIGSQIERLFSIFPQQQVHVIVFDDFVSDTKSSYEDVLEFLRVPSDGREDFSPQNVRRRFKSRRLAWVNWKIRDAGSRLKQQLGIVKSFDILRILNSLNEQVEPRPNLSTEFRRRLVLEFKEDVDVLSQKLQRDLSHWLK